MGRLFINKLTFTGSKGTSTIEFGERLTFITGPSDTGKSYIFKSIDYMLGAKTEFMPFDPSIGYDTIEMEVRDGQENITLIRKIGDTKIKTIINGEESIHTLKGKNGIVNFYNRLIGIPDGYKVPKNETGQTQALSFRTMKSLFMVKEEDTESERSILLPLQSQSETAFLSGLLYLLYEQDFSEYDPEESKKTKKAQKNAVQNYINNNISKLKSNKEILEKQISGMEVDKDSVEQLIEALEDELNQTNKAINNLLNESRPISLNIIRLEDNIRGKRVLLNRYRALESQYSADIERLGFIVEGEKILHKHDSPSTCPFCNNLLSAHERDSYLEASQAEVKKIILNSTDLIKTIDDLVLELEGLDSNLNELKSKKHKIEETINKQLTPQKLSINKRIKEYTDFKQANEKLNWINNLLNNYDDDLDGLDATIEQNTVYKPKTLFGDEFESFISENYLNILKDIHFSPADSASFDMGAFDIVVNGQEKKTHGKGYRALLNSIMILTMRNYINSVARKNPHFYLIDSPLHGLSLPTGIENTNVRTGFFSYLAKNYGDDQIIIIENINDGELPENIHTDPNIKVIEFTQDENEGRYGLLNGIKKQ